MNERRTRTRTRRTRARTRAKTRMRRTRARTRARTRRTRTSTRRTRARTRTRTRTRRGSASTRLGGVQIDMAHWQLRGDSPVSSQGECRPIWLTRTGYTGGPKRGPERRGRNGPPEEALAPEGQSRGSEEILGSLSLLS